MKQRRLTHNEKTELFIKYKTGEYTAVDLAKKFPITSTAILGLLKRQRFKIKSQSELQRKYAIVENYFDEIDTQEKAYILGLLYADGCNYMLRNAVTLALKESDINILKKITGLIQPQKPIRFIKKEKKEWSNIYQITIQNKHISQRLAELGCMNAKTFKIKFPEWLNNDLTPHFVRGYFDGDGWVGKASICIVSTLNFCNSLSKIIKEKLNINTYIRARCPERKNNIRMLEISGGKQTRKFLKWMYKDATIFIERKYNKFLEHLEYEKDLGKTKLCNIDGCNKKSYSKGYCRKHHYRFCGGKEKRRKSYEKLGK